ncbi:hypothetical protein [Pedobacter sp. SYSU D00535]|uniref:HYC_CC_PP family protein n=1 Tax=Pedobacter sp. SYSU D00535 TaxID=2810308 RepID=UPI001A9715F7|nr:hypothetical protein [Pedobacter sp. SYSU D00535]
MKLFRRYIVLTLAMLITISASGISISLHKCCGSIKDFTLFGEADECNMESAKPSCEPDKYGVAKHKGKNCCQDQEVTVKKTSHAAYSKSDAQTKPAFDVLLILNFVRGWFGYNQQEAEDEDDRSPVLYFPESLTILFRQFRL